MKGRMMLSVALLLMVIVAFETYNQATRTLAEPALRRSVTRGADVLRLVQKTLAMSRTPAALPSSTSPELSRLAAAFHPLDRGLLAAAGVARRRADRLGRDGDETAQMTRQVTGASRLMVIMSARGQRMALIESKGKTQTVHPGTRVGEETVVRIEADHVLLRGPDGTRELRFDDALQQ